MSTFMNKINTKPNNTVEASYIDSSAMPSMVDAITDELKRANMLLDSQRDKVLYDVLNIQNRADLMRAIQSYDRAFLLNLHLSLDAVSEAAKTLCDIAVKYKSDPSADWVDIANGIYRFDAVFEEFQEETDEEDSGRYKADL